MSCCSCVSCGSVVLKRYPALQASGKELFPLARKFGRSSRIQTSEQRELFVESSVMCDQETKAEAIQRPTNIEKLWSNLFNLLSVSNAVEWVTWSVPY